MRDQGQAELDTRIDNLVRSIESSEIKIAVEEEKVRSRYV